MQDVELVDLLDAGETHAPGHRLGLDLQLQLLARPGGQLLGVVQTLWDLAGIVRQDDRARAHRPGPRPAPGLVDPADRTADERPFQQESGTLGHQRTSFFTWSCRKQQVKWSLTIPTACIHA